MSSNSFNAALEFALRWETGGDMVNGGYTNDPADPGGETKWGISKRSHPQLDIRNLSLDEAKMIYYNEYWLKAECDKLEFKSAVAVFDTAVNCGVSRAQKWSLLYGTDWRSIALARMMHYSSLPPKWKSRFLGGVINRLADLSAKLLTLGACSC